MLRWCARVLATALIVVVFNVLWNIAGTVALTPNSPAPVVHTTVK